MIQGYLDGIASSGYIDGWALNREAPLMPVTVAVLDGKNHEIAWGLAHAYRDDLALAGLAGWCAFRVRTEASVTRLRNQELILMERTTSTEICRRKSVPYLDSGDTAFLTMADAVAADPTTIKSISQLRGCDQIFAQYLKAHGVDAFVRAAYVYTLGRAADPSGRATYGNMIRKNSFSPFQLLEILSDSEEFRSRMRLLAAPNTIGFPFG
jgi:hypothetical protein